VIGEEAKTTYYHKVEVVVVASCHPGLEMAKDT